MNKEDFIKNVNDPKNIPGIYNYCDRWCERCSFTDKCSNYAISDEQFKGVDLNLEKDEFWNKLGEVFEVTMQMIKDSAKEMGIDLSNIEFDDAETTLQKFEKYVQKYECSIVSKDYIAKVGAWLDSLKDILEEKEKEWENSLQMGIDTSEIEELDDILEIINWYKFQIHVKITRALTGKIEDQDITGNDLDEFPKDSDGSAKVALIGIDRSMAAWGKMLSIFPEKEDEIFKILIQLERLRNNTEIEFPNARTFIRPGFDE